MATEQEFLELQRKVAELTRRVYRLENMPQNLSAPPLEAMPPVAPAVPQPPPAPAAPAGGYTYSSAFPQGTPPSGVPPADATSPDDPGLETRIGSQWLNRIGIAAVLIGVAYFLKLAFENDWIGPAGQVAIVLFGGAALVAWANWLYQNGHEYFSYSLTAVGVGMMYGGIWAAFQVHHLIPGAAAFVGMIVVTAAAAMIALRQDAMIIAAVALTGGFATPILLSTGQNRPVELFSYIALLDIFAIVLVSMRPWRRLLAGAFVGTVVYYVGWYDSQYKNEQDKIAIFFVTLFFLIFAILPVLKWLHPKEESKAFVRSKTFTAVAMFNPVFYFFSLLAIFEPSNRASMTWVALGLAAFYIYLGGRLRAIYGEDEERFSQLLHLAIGIGFITVAIPLRLQGHWITIGWMFEAAVLLYVAERTQSAFLKVFSIVALGLGVGRLIFLDNFHTTRLFFNARFATYLVALVIFAVIAYRAYQDTGDDKDQGFIVATVSFNILALMAFGYEIHDHFARQLSAVTSTNTNIYDPRYYGQYRDVRLMRNLTFSGLGMAYGAVLLAFGFIQRMATIRWQALLLLVMVILKVFLSDLSTLSGAYRVLSLIALGVLLLGVSFLYQKGWLNPREDA